ncbi:MAG: phosphatase PAP2 family protein [Lachnospiraceae bacterium]|nr:phosphatase PAP2 family protein [Lachnospiraceae bacterium]
MDQMYRDRYDKLSGWIRKKPYRYEIFIILYKTLPLLVMVTYAVMIFYGIYKLNREEWIRIIAVPAVTFLAVTIFRKLINEKRPYEVYDIQPLVYKSKQGESFPSRHMVSVVIIAMAGFYISSLLGGLLMMVSALIGILRPAAGVHYVRDILGGFFFSLLMGIIGFYVI